jgi:hypothetical protein
MIAFLHKSIAFSNRRIGLKNGHSLGKKSRFSRLSFLPETHDEREPFNSISKNSNEYKQG